MIQSLPSVSKKDDPLLESTKSQKPHAINYQKLNLQLGKIRNGAQKQPKKVFFFP